MHAVNIATNTSNPVNPSSKNCKPLFFSFEEEEQLTLLDVTNRVGTAFYAEKVTKKFYDRFKKEHDAFLKFLNGIPNEEMQKWYVSVMLNRLMFIYFIEKKGFFE